MMEKEPDSSFSLCVSDSARERGGKPQKQKKSFGRHSSFPKRQNKWDSQSIPMEPHRTNRGMLYEHNNQKVLSITLQQQMQDFTNVVIQGISREKLYSRLQLQKSASTAAGNRKRNHGKEKVHGRKWTRKSDECSKKTFQKV